MLVALALILILPVLILLLLLLPLRFISIPATRGASTRGRAPPRRARGDDDGDAFGVLVGRLRALLRASGGLGAVLRASWAVSEPSCGKPLWALFGPV